jgi:thioredoxin-related protein
MPRSTSAFLFAPYWLRPVLTTVLLVILSIVTMGISQAQDWYENAAGYQKALDEHNANGKPLFVYFHNPYCKYCVEYESQVLNTGPVQAHLNNKFIKVKVLWDERGTPEDDLATSLGVTGTPAVYVKSSRTKKFTKVYYTQRKNGQSVPKASTEYIKSLDAAQK